MHRTASVEYHEVRRDVLARRVGYEDWEAAIRQTAHLSTTQAGRLLGVSHASILTWREQLQVVSTRPVTVAERAAAMRADRTDSRHGTANGYRNAACRCRPCTDAWAIYQRDRRHAAAQS